MAEYAPTTRRLVLPVPARVAAGSGTLFGTRAVRVDRRVGARLVFAMASSQAVAGPSRTPSSRVVGARGRLPRDYRTCLSEKRVPPFGVGPETRSPLTTGMTNSISFEHIEAQRWT